MSSLDVDVGELRTRFAAQVGRDLSNVRRRHIDLVCAESIVGVVVVVVDLLSPLASQTV